MDTVSDAEVLAGFRTGRPESIEVVRGWVQSAVRGGNWRFHDPEGVTQEVLLTLTRQVRGDRVRQVERFRSYAYSVARRTCVTVYHQERRSRSVEAPEAGEDAAAATSDPHADVERRERLDMTLLVFQRLPAQCKDLWTSVFIDGLQADAVGRELGISANNVRVRVHRCLERARKLYREVAGHV